MALGDPPKFGECVRCGCALTVGHSCFPTAAQPMAPPPGSVIMTTTGEPPFIPQPLARTFTLASQGKYPEIDAIGIGLQLLAERTPEERVRIANYWWRYTSDENKRTADSRDAAQ